MYLVFCFVSAMLVTKTSPQYYSLSNTELSLVRDLFTVQVPGLYMFLLKTCHHSNENATVDLMHNTDVLYSNKIWVHDDPCVTYPAMGQMSLGDQVSARVTWLTGAWILPDRPWGTFELDIALMHV